MNNELIERIDNSLPNGTPIDSTARQYYDAEQNPITLLRLIKSEPEWAQSRILHLERLLIDCKAALSQREAEPARSTIAEAITHLNERHNSINWRSVTEANGYNMAVTDLQNFAPKPAPLPQPVASVPQDVDEFIAANCGYHHDPREKRADKDGFVLHIHPADLRAWMAGHERAKIDPDQAMLDAARDWSYKKYGRPIGNDAAIGCWQSMLTASKETQNVV